MGDHSSFQSHSQFGEDLALVEFFGTGHCGYFVDVGANDGIRDSNTALLEELGWHGLLVEANPAMVQKAERSRISRVVHRAVAGSGAGGTLRFYCVSEGPENLNGLSTAKPGPEFLAKIATLGGRISEVNVRCASLTEILREADVPREFDVLSIDVEGNELDALSGLDFDLYSPRILLVEDNSRGLDGRVAALLSHKGYLRVHRTGVNDWFVKPPDARRFFVQRIKLRLRLWKWRAERMARGIFRGG